MPAQTRGVEVKSKHRLRSRGHTPRRHMPPRLAPREVLRHLFPEPYLALGTAFGDPVPPEWRVFKAEAEDALRHPYQVRVRR